jgi:hypothetical protein
VANATRQIKKARANGPEGDGWEKRKHRAKDPGGCSYQKRRAHTPMVVRSFTMYARDDKKLAAKAKAAGTSKSDMIGRLIEGAGKGGE